LQCKSYAQKDFAWQVQFCVIGAAISDMGALAFLARILYLGAALKIRRHLVTIWLPFNPLIHHAMDGPLEETTHKHQDLFLQEVKALVEKDLSNTEFSISKLAARLMVSRAQFYRKVKTLTGKSPSVFIRKVRLQKARHLLETTVLNISEIAYEVGFRDHAYFTRIFREEYGMAPRAWRKK